MNLHWIAPGISLPDGLKLDCEINFQDEIGKGAYGKVFETCAEGYCRTQQAVLKSMEVDGPDEWRKLTTNYQTFNNVLPFNTPKLHFSVYCARKNLGYFVMDKLNARSIEYRDFLDPMLMKQFAGILLKMREAHLCHRDLHKGNILISGLTVYIIDFDLLENIPFTGNQISSHSAFDSYYSYLRNLGHKEFTLQTLRPVMYFDLTYIVFQLFLTKTDLPIHLLGSTDPSMLIVTAKSIPAPLLAIKKAKKGDIKKFEQYVNRTV